MGNCLAGLNFQPSPGYSRQMTFRVANLRLDPVARLLQRDGLLADTVLSQLAQGGFPWVQGEARQPDSGNERAAKRRAERAWHKVTTSEEPHKADSAAQPATRQRSSPPMRGNRRNPHEEAVRVPPCLRIRALPGPMFKN
jgi:hypothetical protein